MKSLETRLAAIFDLDHVPDVTESTLRQYRAHLLQNFDPTTVLTGREDFPWEESYVFGPPRPEEYEMMKKDNPSYKDEYVLVDILDEEVEERDVLARIKRITDKKVFVIGLSWLKTRNKKSKDHRLLEDYLEWTLRWWQ